MAIPPSKGKLLYHITHRDNLKSILEAGLVPRGSNPALVTDIADSAIIDKRKELSVDLTQFVPFHFFVRNPFAGAVCRKYGAENMAIIAIPRPREQEMERFRIIPSHPLGNEDPEILSYEEGLAAIRWDILDLEKGRDYHNQTIKNACLAECISLDVILPERFSRIFVSTDETAARLGHLANGGHLKISVAPHMFPGNSADSQ